MAAESTVEPTREEFTREELEEDEESDIYEFEGEEEEEQGAVYEPNEEEDEEEEEEPPVNSKAGLTALLLGNGGPGVPQEEEEEEGEEEEEDDEYHEESFEAGSAEHPIDLESNDVVSKGTKRGVEELSDDDASSSGDIVQISAGEEKNPKKARV